MEGGGLGTGSRRCKSVVCVGVVALRPAIYVLAVTLKAWAAVAGLVRATGSVRLMGRLTARLRCVRRNRKRVGSGLMHATSGLLGVHRTGRKGVVPRGLAWFGDVKWRRMCVWGDRASGRVVLERVVADLATTRRTGGRCRCGLAMGNSVAPVVRLVVAHHKHSHCAASASDGAREGDAEAVVQAPVGLVVE